MHLDRYVEGIALLTTNTIASVCMRDTLIEIAFYLIVLHRFHIFVAGTWCVYGGLNGYSTVFFHNNSQRGIKKFQ